MSELRTVYGSLILIDEEDYSLLSRYNWYELQNISGTTYAQTFIDGTCVLLHRLIMNPSPAMQVDHINHEGLDNRKCNLRVVSKSHNQMNRKKTSGLTSEYIGVSWHKKSNKWRVTARNEVTLVVTHIGLFKDEIAAAKAYDSFCRQYNSLSLLNFPEEV